MNTRSFSSSAHALWLLAAVLALLPLQLGSASDPTSPPILTPAAAPAWGESILHQKPEWYASANARALADNVVQYQSPQGGWPKNTDLAAPPRSPEVLTQVHAGNEANTIDNGATTLPLRFLALVVNATPGGKYQAAFERGLDYLFAAQYANGGWPQFFPLRKGGYYSHITFNDNAMVNVLLLLRAAAKGEPPYTFVDKARRARAKEAVARGVECILGAQIRQGDKLTAWCAQHDEKDLSPVGARKFEPPSLSGAESVGIVRFLMGEPKPSPEVIAAIEGAVAWFRAVAITGLRQERFIDAAGKPDKRVVGDPSAGLLWARFYELGSNRPIFTGRDGIIRYSLSEIEQERRAGYAYYGDWPAALLSRDYPQWRAKQGLR